MRKTILSLILIFCTVSAYSQSNNADLESLKLMIEELKQKQETTEQKIQEINNELETIREINEALKDKYELFQGEKNAYVEDLEMKLVSVTGNKNSKQVVVEYLINNTGDEVVNTSVSYVKAVDESGNEHTCKWPEIGDEDRWYSKELYPDTPLKVFMTFPGFSEESKYVRKINFELLRSEQSLDGMQIDWE